MSYYLLVAKYNHESLTKFEEGGKNTARDRAERLFGRGDVSTGDGLLVRDGDGTVHNIVKPPQFDWQEHTVFLGTFPYSQQSGHKETRLYGWVAIVASELERDELLREIGWDEDKAKRSLFCQVFDIHLSEVGPSILGSALIGLGDEKTEGLNLSGILREATSWEDRAIATYHEQTPAMWVY